jgi:poly(hydroxyalkanoate) depolymerase family esterase
MVGLDQDEMAQALKLTRAGRLAEATELIQRTLRSASASGPIPTSSASLLPPKVGGSSSGLGRLKPLSRIAQCLRRSLGTPQDLSTPFQNPDVLRRQAPPPGSLGTGVLLDRMYENGSGARGYKIYVPPDCPHHGVSVIVMLHGGTQAVLDYAAGTAMNQLSDRHHFLVVYPQQDSRANPMRYWNWFRDQDQHRGTGEPALIAGITEQVIGDYDANPDRIFIAGFSAGAAMAMVMSSTYPDLYAAAGIHSGLPYGAACDVPSAFALMGGASRPSRRYTPITLPLIIFHGDDDEIVNVANAGYIREQRLGVDGALTAADGVNVMRGRVSGGHAYTRTTYADETEVLLEQWIVHGAGHTWFGGTTGCSYTDPLGPDSSAEIVRFFDEHSR